MEMDEKLWVDAKEILIRQGKKISEGGQTLNQVTQKAYKISVSGDTQHLTRQGPEQADPTFKRALEGEKRRG